jgi:hypothetical protein
MRKFCYVGEDAFWERTAWAAEDEAFLVLDLNADGTRGAGDGQIDQRSELVLSDWGPEGATDMQALAKATDEAGNLLFDTNGNCVLDADDTSYGEFRVWQDFDQDGAVDEGELRTLAEARIGQIQHAIRKRSRSHNQLRKWSKFNPPILDDFNAHVCTPSGLAPSKGTRC